MARTIRITATRPRPLLILGIISLIGLAACGGSASAAPNQDAGATAPPVGTPAPSVDTGGGQSSSPGNGSSAFESAASALDALDSYAFSVEIASTTVENGVDTVTHTIMSGVVENKPDKASSLIQQELDADGKVTSNSGIIVISTKAWVSDGADTPTWTEIPASQADLFIQSMAAFRPEQMFGLYFAGIGGNFTSVGDETKNGVQATHFKGDDSIGSVLGAIAGFQGTWTSDAWIARDGGFLVHSEAGATGATAGTGDSYKIVVDITDPNSAGPIEPPK